MNSKEIEQEAGRLYEIAVDSKRDAEWAPALRQADLQVVISVIGRLGSTGTTGAQLEARREAARAVVESRLTDRLESTMVRLEKSSARLSKIGLCVSIVMLLAAVAEILF